MTTPSRYRRNTICGVDNDEQGYASHQIFFELCNQLASTIEDKAKYYSRIILLYTIINKLINIPILVFGAIISFVSGYVVFTTNPTLNIIIFIINLLMTILSALNFYLDLSSRISKYHKSVYNYEKLARTLKFRMLLTPEKERKKMYFDTLKELETIEKGNHFKVERISTETATPNSTGDPLTVRIEKLESRDTSFGSAPERFSR